MFSAEFLTPVLLQVGISIKEKSVKKIFFWKVIIVLIFFRDHVKKKVQHCLETFHLLSKDIKTQLQ